MKLNDKKLIFKKNLLEGESNFMKSLEDLKKLHEEAAKKLALRHQKEGYKVCCNRPYAIFGRFKTKIS